MIEGGAPKERASERLSKKTLFAYSLADLPIAMSLFPVIVFIPRFYSAELGVPLAWVGTILIVQRIFDLVTDPIMGIVSDRTRSRFGRDGPGCSLPRRSSCSRSIGSSFRRRMPGAGTCWAGGWCSLSGRR